MTTNSKPPTGADLAALRKRHGMSQAQAAVRFKPAGISRRSIQNWEQGVRAIPGAAWRYMLAQLGELRLPE